MNRCIDPPFRLLYDLRWMELGKAGGVEQAAYELILAISRRDRRNRFQIFAPRSACWEWTFPTSFDVRRIPSDPGDPGAQRFHESVASRRAGFDLVHSTCSYVNPELIDFPAVLTIHDLQHLHYPEFFTPADWEDRERLYRESAARAGHVICISEFTRRDVHERYGVPLERLTTIWNIPSSAVWHPLSDATARRLVARMGIEGPFLFYPAQAWPHKNHERLVKAFVTARAEMPGDVRLVLTGSPLPPSHPAVAVIQEAGLQSRVLHLGFRSPLEMRALYQRCLALVFPSLFEGFGMPVAEAMIAGKPVACSNVTSLPEIAGDAAVTFDPTDIQAIARGMLEVARNEPLRAALSEAARMRRTLFSAQRSAIRTLAVYEHVVRQVRGASA